MVTVINVVFIIRLGETRISWLDSHNWYQEGEWYHFLGFISMAESPSVDVTTVILVSHFILVSLTTLLGYFATLSSCFSVTTHSFYITNWAFYLLLPPLKLYFWFFPLTLPISILTFTEGIVGPRAQRTWIINLCYSNY